ncbi:hypothetical protein [Crossiella sp. CA198]|uniref:hypothetical protein n=1 Tax=Crossiella sp. CA198 TaxID=3455607 RepID=UPI003F8D4C05
MRWDEAINVFSDNGVATSTYPKVPERATVIAPRWLSSDCFRRPRGPGNHLPGNMWHVETMTLYTSYYGVADPTPELEQVMKPFYANGSKILDALLFDHSTVASRATFERADNTLKGAADWLTAQVTPLRTERDQVGKRGDHFQGTGANAFWNVLDELRYRCEDLVAQLSKQRTAWDALGDAKEALRQATVTLNDGYHEWLGEKSFSYDTGLGFQVSANGSALAWPGGAITAIWTAPELVADFRAHGPQDYYKDQESYPTSTLLGGKVTEGGMWERLENAAKKIWEAHQIATLDVAATTAISKLDKDYLAAAAHLPTIVTPIRFVLPPGSGPGPEPGPDPGPGPGPDGAPEGGGGQSEIGGGQVPPPPPPSLGPNPGPKGPASVISGPNSMLKVPTGSHVGTDGTVYGPDGKPVLGPDGRPIIVPPGSRVTPNGTIVGPRGNGRLEQKDRIRQPFQPPGGTGPQTGGQSPVERYLQSLRRTPPPLPPLRPPNAALPMTMSSADPLSVHSGPGPAGGGKVGLSPSATAPFTATGGGKPMVPTLGGPSGVDGPKGNAGNGGVPFHPPTAGGPGAGAQDKGERDRDTWLAEDEQTWGTETAVAPGVLGRRKRRTRFATGTRLGAPALPGPPSGLDDRAAGHGTANG